MQQEGGNPTNKPIQHINLEIEKERLRELRAEYQRDNVLRVDDYDEYADLIEKDNLLEFYNKVTIKYLKVISPVLINIILYFVIFICSKYTY